MKPSSNPPNELSAAKQLRTILHPKSLLKTLASVVPFAGAGVEMLNQLDNQRVDHRLTTLEEVDLQRLARLQNLEQAGPPTPPLQPNEWPHAVSEYLGRNVQFAVVYHSPEYPVGDYIIPLGHGCLLGDDHVLTCTEALESVQAVGKQRNGRVIIMSGMVWYEFVAEPANDGSGLVVCRITSRDEETWKEAQEFCARFNMPSRLKPLTKVPVKVSITPWLGQEVGWIHAGEAEDTMREGEVSHIQFEKSWISHFKRPSDNALKVFVTAPFASHILEVGSAVFDRQGTLLGIVSGIQRFQNDAGNRAVIKSLLGLTRFMDESKKNRPA